MLPREQASLALRCRQSWRLRVRARRPKQDGQAPFTHARGANDSRPVVWCASGEDEIAAWDVADGTCQRVLAVSRRFEKDGDFAKSGLRALGDCGRLSAVRPGSADDGSLLGFRAVELGDAPARAAGARCLLPLPSGALLSGLDDGRLPAAGVPGTEGVRVPTGKDSEESRCASRGFAPPRLLLYGEYFALLSRGSGGEPIPRCKRSSLSSSTLFFFL